MSISPKKTKNNIAIGNDIVDLSDTDSLDILKNIPFLKRVFTESELNSIQTSNNSYNEAWGIWAAKESAYKVARQLNNKTIFSPKLYCVDPKNSVVIRDQHSYQYKKIETTEYVHTVALSRQNSPQSKPKDNLTTDDLSNKIWIKSLPDLMKDDEIKSIAMNIKAYNEQSQFCRAYATWILRNELSLKNGYIHKEFLGPRCPPELYDEQSKLRGSAISLSHQGHFCAVAICGDLIK